MGNAFAVLMLIWDTFVFRQGLLGVLFKRFRPYLIIAPIALATTIVVRGARMVMIIEGMSAEEIWASSGYFTMYLIYNTVSVFYYVAIMHTAHNLGDADLYTSEKWVVLD